MYDVRNRQSLAPDYITLTVAKAAIPKFDSSSQNRLHEFLNAITYAMNNIDPIKKQKLIEAILYTKLKGKSMLDLDTKNIRNFEQL